jgi:[protein-PII] uridylyltransferase
VGNPPSSAATALNLSSLLTSGDAQRALAERTAQVDRLVLDCAGELLPGSTDSTGLAILAVGGYGRRHLFPYSDVDLLLLVQSERLAQARKESIAAFLQLLWDSGIRVSHSVRTPAECAEVHNGNIELNVSLLDQRFLAGDRALYADLARRLPRFVQGSRETLVRNLAQLTRERHAKFAHTFYHLEPNVKETPGGLRDYQLVCWLQQLRETDAARLGSADPAPELHTAFRFQARLRFHLHCLFGRDNNLLTFDAQDAIAEEWGEGDPAAWMREYYRHSRAVHRAAVRALESSEARSSALFAQFRDWRARVANADFSVHRERAHFRAPQALDTDPELALRMFEFVARHGIRISFEAEQQIEARWERLRAWFAEPRPLWPAFGQILTLPHTSLALRAMHETGILQAVFPELTAMECLVIRDFYHRYTVDEHTLVAIQNLLTPAGPYTGLLAEVGESAPLLFALLFHDAGKGLVGEGHVEGSLRLAAAAMARIQMPAADRETVLFLIGRHLDLSAVIQSRDLFDPQTIREVAQQMQTVERLKALTLLTYADISAVNPNAMTPWRAEQLWQLYLMVYNELTRELESDRIDAQAGPPEWREFLEGFPVRYLRTHGEREIAAHMALEQKSRKRGVAVEMQRREAAWEMTLVAADRPGLFATVAGTLAAFGMNILKAEAFSNRRGMVLDTFAFADPMRNLDQNPTEIDRLRTTMERALLGKTDAKELLRNRPKPTPPSRSGRIPGRVSFNANASHTATLVEIVAEDRPGLLYDLASAISSSGANIEVVLIDTQAHKAIDVFYLTVDGRKLDADEQRVLDEALRRACGG